MLACALFKWEQSGGKIQIRNMFFLLLCNNVFWREGDEGTKGIEERTELGEKAIGRADERNEKGIWEEGGEEIKERREGGEEYRQDGQMNEIWAKGGEEGYERAK
jgi:hypothetical protein